ncbi:MAG TPA: response regulator [Xanthomonadaceae bacterium]|nr:response regulator [Xanthomonadaceae bacterium]
MIRVYLVDDHAIVRAGVAAILADRTDIEVVGSAASGEEALPEIRRLDPDVVLCDLHLPGISGLEVTERIVRGQYGPRVVILSVQEEGPYPRRVLEAGASGYVTKAGEATELLRAIREVAAGRRYLGGEVARQLALSALSGKDNPFDTLSPRELEVARHMARGNRTSQIADCLKLSPKTVATHKYRLYEKLGIGDPVTLARLASQFGVV